MPIGARRRVVAPAKRRVDDHAFRQPLGAIARVRRQIAIRMADGIAEQSIAPLDRPGDRLGVGIEQKLGGIEAMAARRVVGTLDAITIKLSGPQLRQIDVPDITGFFSQRDLRDFVLAVRPIV